LITRIRLRNWKSHLESEFEFSRGVNAIIGIMGSGKTSIMQAISFGLFGTFPSLQTRRLGLDDLIMRRPQEMDEAEVELDFSIGGKSYSVLRVIRREKGTVKAELREAGRLVEASAQGVTREVSRILDMDYEMFSRAVYSEQNALDYFLRIPRGQRMDHIDRMLRLDRFEVVREQAVSLSNRIRQEREEKLRLLSELRKEELPKRIDQLRGELEGLQKGMQDIRGRAERATGKVRELEKRVSDIEEKERALSEVRRELEGVNSGMAQVEESIRERAGSLKGIDAKGISARLESLEKAVNELKQGIDTAGKGVERGRERVAALNTEIRLVTENMQEIQGLGEVCPVCESELSLPKKRELMGVRKAKEKKLREEVSLAASEMEGSRKTLEEFDERIRQSLEERENLRSLARDVKFLEGLEKRREEYARKREELMKRERSLEGAGDVDVGKLRQGLREAVAEERELKTRLDAAGQRISDREEMLRELRAREEMLIKYKQESMMDQELMERLQAFTGAVKLTQDQLREEFLKSVNQTMNRIWSELYPYGDYTGIRLAIEKDYILQLRQDSGWVNVEGTASGGERSVAALALRVAFSMVFIPNLRWLILDEPTHNLDSNAIEHLTDTLRERIGSFVEQVFLITHDERVSEGVGGNLYRLERNKDRNEPTRIAGLEV
jgi:exonuclease SbcC